MSAVRHRVAACLDAWRVCPGDQDDIGLIVGELAANEARHGRDDMTIMVSVSPAAAHIEVVDSGGPARSRERETDGDECGRGLDIVRCLAQSLQCHRDAAGTRVCADYRLSGVPENVKEAGTGVASGGRQAHLVETCRATTKLD